MHNASQKPPPPVTVDVPVVALNQLCPDGYELILERGGITFQSGQLINVHGRDHLEDRSYTVCSGDRDEYLTVLFKLIPEGILTPQLAALKRGDAVTISGPYGEFLVRDTTRPIQFFATGTGIAPCRSFHRSHRGLNMTLFHGVAHARDLYYREEMQALHYHPCLSRERTEGTFHGRVTDLAREYEFPPDSHFYLCGANEMIYEMREILTARGVDPGCVFAEEYYYRLDD